MDPAQYFKGRLNRLNFLLGIISVIVLSYLLSRLDGRGTMGLFSGVAGLLSMFAVFSIYVRRLHDISMSGWWSLVVLIPLVNLIFFFYLLFTDSKGKNKFGAKPSAKVKYPHDLLLIK